MRTCMAAVMAMAAVAAPVFAATQWVVDAPASQLGWQATFNGQPVKGEFKQWQAEIAFSPEDLAHSRIKVVVPLASVDSGDEERDGTLKGADFFNVAQTPEAVFESFYVQKDGNGYVADGTLTLAGVKKGASLSFTVTITGDKAVAHGTLKLSRKDYGVGKGQWADASQIGDGVDVSFTVNATAKK